MTNSMQYGSFSSAVGVRWAIAAVAALVAATVSPAQVCLEQQGLIGPDTTSYDRFGYAVTIDGDTAAISAKEDDRAGGTDAGSVYIFSRSAGAWLFQTRLSASDAAPADHFGSSVSMSGNTLVVGAEGCDYAGLDEAGAAYVFVRSGGVWTQQARLTASDAATADAFGQSVSVSGDTVVVGAPNGDNAVGAQTGSAYVFVRAGGIWTQQAKLLGSNVTQTGEIGRSAGLSGDTAVIGARNDVPIGTTTAGSAFVFVRAGTVWTQQAKLVASDAASADWFGEAAAISGNTVLIGALRHEIPGHGQGAAYVFVRSGSVWTQQAQLFAPEPNPGTGFGVSVALLGNTAAIGAMYDSQSGVPAAGSVRVFTRSGVTWTQCARLTAANPGSHDYFGCSVALSGNTVVGGASKDGDPFPPSIGSAHVFQCSIIQSCPADISGNGLVNIDDLLALVNAWGPCSGCPGDVNHNNVVNIDDLLLLLNAWGPCP